MYKKSQNELKKAQYQLARGSYAAVLANGSSTENTYSVLAEDFTSVNQEPVPKISEIIRVKRSVNRRRPRKTTPPKEKKASQRYEKKNSPPQAPPRLARAPRPRKSNNPSLDEDLPSLPSPSLLRNPQPKPEPKKKPRRKVQSLSISEMIDSMITALAFPEPLKIIIAMTRPMLVSAIKQWLGQWPALSSLVQLEH